MASDVSTMHVDQQDRLIASLLTALRHSEVTAAKAKGQAEGQKDSLVGNVKEGAGKLTGNKETEAKVIFQTMIPVLVCSLHESKLSILCLLQGKAQGAKGSTQKKANS